MFFLHRYSRNEEYELILPGCLSKLPISVESYEKSPTNWMDDPDYKREFGAFAINSSDCMLSIVRAGTIVKVVRVIQVKSSMGTYIDILVRLPDSDSNREWSIGNHLLNNDVGPDVIPTFKTQFIDFLNPSLEN